MCGSDDKGTAVPVSVSLSFDDHPSSFLPFFLTYSEPNIIPETIQIQTKNFFFFFLFIFSFLCITLFPLGVLYPEHSQLAFDYVIIACSLESIRPGLVQGCKAPNGVG